MPLPLPSFTIVRQRRLLPFIPGSMAPLMRTELSSSDTSWINHDKSSANSSPTLDRRPHPYERKQLEPETLPICHPYTFGDEIEMISKVLWSGHLCGDGPFTRKCHTLLEERLKCNKTLLTTSCTHALELSAMLLELRSEDEVIMPSFTFVSTANAFTNLGVRPVFCDIRSDTLNIDETRIEALITSRTRAIVVVHYAGVSCDMATITAIAKRNNLAVVEDVAHAIFGNYQGQALGTLGEFGAASFHQTKNYSCGEGGALFINAPEFAERAEIIREKGTNRAMFLRGQVDRYSWCDKGSSYLPSEILAAHLWVQLREHEFVQQHRRKLHDFYITELSTWAHEHHVQLPSIPADCQSAYHLFWMLLPSLEIQSRLTSHLTALKIQSTFHYQPLHCSIMGHRYGYQSGDFPVTEMAGERLLRIPFYTGLSMEQAARVVDALKGFNHWT
ncbi:dTDP-4-amino-4,6-dideoxygalactose transaminase [Novipirellula galeiformis]|uniref:dTDP-4-amino-4,6-dideoxygalactose transaminase n=2 Tax=Novipirellula galeiformis TaxID=2528004 RepID=A0A5C6CJW7_9BACT|nr:dTDP-4-amino-4,6-dideoxygalactose transaminase [Novipirellula galeiformis]